ncbi:hypothetical protein V500_00584 [Pseudogymnoascus sp. VKM F-4518 (FW-2643)]|nr:hypothetical protein V500_00584 [Pseudogymnoascus sp. VKM F-4518 (FW-2643)]
MTSSSPPFQWQKGDLWNTDPSTFVARTAVKRKDVSHCYLTDDAIFKLLVIRREGYANGKRLSKFNGTEFTKCGTLRSNHKGRGAPALAPDGTVMTVKTGKKQQHTIVLNGGNEKLLVGDWSLENYISRDSYPGYEAWHNKHTWSGDEAELGGVPATSINSVSKVFDKSEGQQVAS